MSVFRPLFRVLHEIDWLRQYTKSSGYGEPGALRDVTRRPRYENLGPGSSGLVTGPLLLLGEEARDGGHGLVGGGHCRLGRYSKQGGDFKRVGYIL